MASPLQWIFQVLDKVSGPAGAMTTALDRYLSKLGGVESKLSSVKERQSSFAESLTAGIEAARGGVEVFRGFAEGLMHIAESAGHAAVGFGEFVVGVAAEREHTLVGLRTVLGTQAAAQQVFNESMQIAQNTPFLTADVIQDRMTLILGGFTQDESRVLYAAASDLGAVLGRDRMQTLESAFRRIGARGQLSGRVWEELDSAGVGRRAVFEEFARRRGRADLLHNQRALAAWAEPMIAHLTSDRALTLITQAISTKFGGGGAAGTQAQAQAETLGGVLSNLRSRPFEMFAQLDLEHIPGMESFRGFLIAVMHAFDAGTSAASRLRVVVAQVVDDFFGGFGGAADAVPGFVDRLLGGFEGFERILHTVVPLVRAFIGGFASHALTAITDQLGQMGAELNSTDPAAQARQWESFGERAGDALGSLMQGVHDLIATVVPAVRSFFDTLTSSANEHVPLFNRFGEALGTAIVTGIVNGIKTHAGTALREGLSDVLNPFNERTQARLQAQGPDVLARTLAHPEAFVGLSAPVPSAFSSRGEIASRIRVEVHATGDGAQNLEAAQHVGNNVGAHVRDTMRRTDLGSATL